jgi:hypothetical protein
MAGTIFLGPKQSFPRIVFRYVSGRPIDGRFRSDATFFSPATKSLLAHKRLPSKWSALPGWKRVAWRLGVPIGVILVMWIQDKLTHLTVTEKIVLAYVGWFLGNVLIGLVVWVGPKVWKRLRYHHTYVRPLQHALTATLDSEPKIVLPTNFHHDEDAKGIISLPVRLTLEDNRRTIIEKTITQRLGDDCSFQWNLVGSSPKLTLTPAPLPPRYVTFKDIESRMHDVKPFSSVLGLGSRRKTITWDIGNPKSIAVHMLISAATGGGKSTLTKLVIMQWLADGGIVIICDIKRISHLWAKDLPGVIYCTKIDDIHMAQIALATQCDARYDIIESQANENAIVEMGLPPILLVNEEFNVAMRELRSYWAKQEESKLIKTSPSVDAWSKILLTGRQARVHALGITQMGTVRAVGGTENREQFTDRALMNYSPNAAKMLCPDVVLPPASRNVGSSVLYHSGTFDRYQIAHISTNEAKQWAIDGQKRLELEWPKWPNITAALESWMPREIEYDENRPIITQLEETDTVMEPVSLKEAIDAGLLDMTLDAARKAAQRPGFPDVKGIGPRKTKLYMPDTLTAWQESKARNDMA